MALRKLEIKEYNKKFKDNIIDCHGFNSINIANCQHIC